MDTNAKRQVEAAKCEVAKELSARFEEKSEKMKKTLEEELSMKHENELGLLREALANAEAAADVEAKIMEVRENLNDELSRHHQSEMKDLHGKQCVGFKSASFL